MNVEKNSQSAQPQLCKACNKFFSTEAYEWLCSKCYGTKHNIDAKAIKKNVKQQKAQEPLNKPVPSKGIQENKQRCFNCKKKIGLLGIQCKCGYVYCNAHRLPENHECPIDYQEKGKQKLKKQIIKVEHGKLNEL